MDDDTTMMGTRVRFQTTRWNLVQSGRDPAALGSLINLYWKPLYFFVRQHGYDNETSKDIVQEFLTLFLERQTILKADPARGRFRTFLLAALSNFLKDWSKAASREKRGGGRPTLSLDFARGESDYSSAMTQTDTPESALNRAWARGLWERALSELKADPPQLEAFKLYLNDADYRSIAETTGLPAKSIGSLIRRMKAQLKGILLQHIGETVSNEDELAAEVEEFKALLSGTPRSLGPN